MINLVTVLTGIESLLNKNNTNTSAYYVSSSLTSQVQKFYKGTSGLSERLPIPSVLYPAVCVELESKQEEWSQIGRATAKRDMTLKVNIIPIINYGAGVITDEAAGREMSNLECITLAQNIEYLIRNKIDLSLTTQGVLSCLIDNTEYGVSYNSNDTYVSMARISLNIRALNN
jgi:hypothetical protein